LYTYKNFEDVRLIATDPSSRTSVALAQIIMWRMFRRRVTIVPIVGPLATMLRSHDAALLIGDRALFVDEDEPAMTSVNRLDLGKAWTDMTGLPFVYAFWASWPNTIGAGDVEALIAARNRGVKCIDEVARLHCKRCARRQPVAARYLSTNIRYGMGDHEMSGLTEFYREAASLGLAKQGGALTFV
jgi:chorismate dehydratase